MARSRNIKPSLFKNEILGQADPLLTILFEGLWCLADREGRLEDRPLRIKAEIFPYRELPNFNGYLTELERLGFIHRYSEEGIDVIQVINFKKHQNPHKTEKNSELPKSSTKPNTYNNNGKYPLNNGEITEAARLIPDSLNLIPDSNNTALAVVANAPVCIKEKLDYKDLITLLPDLPQQVAKDFLTARKAKKLPLTKTALSGIAKEAERANITLSQAIGISAANGWAGFKSSWIKEEDGKTWAEKKQQYLDEQAKKYYSGGLMQCTEDELRRLGLL